MWNLINNNLKIFIDPFIFLNLKNLEERILLVNTFQHYFTALDPNLCDINFFFPKYIEEDIGFRRTFLHGDKVNLIAKPPEKLTIVFPIDSKFEPTEIGKAVKMLNEFFSIAIENKCIFYLSEYEFNKEKKIEIEKTYGIQVVSLQELYKKIEIYTQGFFNYFKFRLPVYGIDSPDIAHSMSDEFHNKVLIYLESEINKNQPSEESKERIRSFVHNRYVDILVTIDRISFFKLQQEMYDIENGFIGDNENKKPKHHGYIRYYLNYYLFLLWGAVDHLAWIINDIFSFGYSPDNAQGRRSVGLSKEKKEFLEKIKNQDGELYNFITSNEFQDWLFFFSQLRHTNAHREMFSASPLLITTEESKISNEEIDKIIYKNEPAVREEIKHLLPPEFEENQKIIDRNNYRISKMKKGIDHFALIKKDGAEFIFNPVNRIQIDMNNIQSLIQKVFDAYKKKKV